MLVRQRKLKISDMHTQETMEPINKRYEKRETNREAKALVAAKLENAIEKELLNRLQAGTYKDIYNLAQDEFNKALDEQELEEEAPEQFEEDYSDGEEDSMIGGFEGGESEIDEDELEKEMEAERMAQLEDSPDSDEEEP